MRWSGLHHSRERPKKLPGMGSEMISMDDQSSDSTRSAVVLGAADVDEVERVEESEAADAIGRIKQARDRHATRREVGNIMLRENEVMC